MCDVSTTTPQTDQIYPHDVYHEYDDEYGGGTVHLYCMVPGMVLVHTHDVQCCCVRVVYQVYRTVVSSSCGS